MLLGVVFASLVACAESGFFSPGQLPMLEVGAALASNAASVVMLMPYHVPASLWILGLCLMFTSTFHARHVFTMHRRLNNAAAALASEASSSSSSGDAGAAAVLAAAAGGAARYVNPSTWLPVRVAALVLPFVCLWIALPFGLSDSNKNNSDGWVLVAGHAAYALASLGTLAPTLCFLNDRTLATPGGNKAGGSGGGSGGGGGILNLYKTQEYLRLLWVVLNGVTLALLGFLGGAKVHTPIALVVPAVAYFCLTAWPDLPEFRIEHAKKSSDTAKNTRALALSPSFSSFSSFKKKGGLLGSWANTPSMVVPRGLATMCLAVFCLAVCVASRYVAGNSEPSAALAPFFALLVGTAAYYANGEDEGLQTPRITLAAAFLVSSFWTGRYSSLVTQAFAAIVWALLQLSEWRSVVAQATSSSSSSSSVAVVKPSSSSVSGGQHHQQQQQQELKWHEKSLPPHIFFLGALLTSASFAMTDWIDRYDVEDENDNGGGGQGGFFIGRALFSVTFLPILAAAANVRRATLDSSTDKGTCCLIALTLPLLAAFTSSGPWYSNTAVLSFFFALAALVSMRLVNDREIWSSRGIAMHQPNADKAVYLLFLILFTSTLAVDLFEYQNWVITILSFASAGMEGVATLDAATRLAMTRPPIVGGLVLFIFSTLAESTRNSDDDGDDFTDAGRACVPLLLLIPLVFIGAGLGGRLRAKVSVEDLRVDISLACVAYSLCAAPFTGVVVGSDVTYKYENNGSDDDDVKSTQLPDSAWTLMVMILLTISVLGATVFFSLKASVGSQALLRSVSSDGSATAGNTAREGQPRGQLDVRDVMVSGGVVLVGCMSVELPAALLVSTLLALVWARQRDSLYGAVLATFLFLSRAFLQIFYGLFGWPANIWLLIFGVLVLLLVALWPNFTLVAKPASAADGSSSSTSSAMDGNVGAASSVFSFAFTAAGVMMIGPATQGWGSLVGTLVRTATLMYQDRETGALRAAVGTPALYFGSLCFILKRYEPDHYISISALATAGAALLGGIGLRLLRPASQTDSAVAHFLVFVVALPFGLASSASTGGYGPIAIALLVGGWAYAHVKQHPLCAIALVFTVPIILMGSVAALVHPEVKKKGKHTLHCYVFKL
jgi:hypothetical protein